MIQDVFDQDPLYAGQQDDELDDKNAVELLSADKFRELAEVTRVKLMWYLVKTLTIFIAILVGIYFWILTNKKSFVANSVNAYNPSNDGIRIVHHA